MSAIRIQMMKNFCIYVDEKRMDQLASKSKKGAALLEYLILNRGDPVPNYRLLSTLWSEEQNANPENALKTLVSRLRVMLNQISPGLGTALVSDRGAYHWELAPGMTVDLYEIESLFDQIAAGKGERDVLIPLYQRLMSVYTGDLLEQAESCEWAMARATMLHNKFMSAVYDYVELLKADENFDEMAAVCRAALDVDEFDDRLHIELMTGLIKTNRTSDALVQYKHVMNLNYRYLGVQPSEEMQEFYKQIVRAGKTMDYNLESIRNELIESGEQRGAFVCEYAVFKEIYNLQMRNLERLGSTMFLAVIMIGNPDDMSISSIKQNNIMNGLMDILKQNLRKGDTITHFSPNVVALLLPTVNYNTGNQVMERIKHLFYRKHANSNITFNYRVGPLSSRKEESVEK